MTETDFCLNRQSNENIPVILCTLWLTALLMVWSQPVWVGGGGVLGCTYFPPYPDFTPNARNRKYGHMTTFILNSPLLADHLWWVGHTNYDVWDHFA